VLGAGRVSADAGADRRLIWGLAAGSLAAVAALLLALDGGDPADRAGGPAATSTSTTVDLGSVPNEELERVVAEHPGVVPMRLALVERYLRGNELANAQRHAEEAAVRAETVEDRAQALRYLGWTTALLGDPEQGEGILVQSLALVPSDRDGLYFLGRVRFELLGRPDLALEPLEQLAAMDMDEAQRQLVDTLLAEVQVAVGAGATAATPTSAP
jgi:tetratricopeptide (TPR) repeat protein